jgi:hypothetical protein
MLRNRRLWLGSVGLGLAALFLATQARAADLIKYLPNDTEFVVTANVRQLLNAPLVQKGPVLAGIKDKLKEDEIKKVLAALGFDPLKDLETITFAGPLSEEVDKKLIIITGNFDVDKFQKAAEEHAKNNSDNLKITKHGDYKVWEVSNVNQPGLPDPAYVAMVDKTTLLMTGGKDYLKEALSKAAGKKTTELNKAIAKLVARVEDKQSFTAMTTLKALAEADFIANLNEQIKPAFAMLKQIKDIDAFSLSVALGKDIKIGLDVNAKDEATAKKMAKAMNQGLLFAPAAIGIAAMQNEQIAPFVDVIKDVVNATKVRAKGDSVSVHVVITQEIIDKGKKAAKKLQGGDD